MTVAELAVVFGLQPKGWGEGENLVRRLASVARRLIGIETVRSLTNMALGAAKAATHTLALAKQFGISSQAVQEFGYVAQQTGSNINQFGAALSQIERNLVSFAHGKGSTEARRAFELFGISQQMAADSLNRPDGLKQIIFTMADRAKALGNNMLVSGSVMKIAGRYAQGFAADLSNGSEGMRQMIDRIHQLGGVVDDKQLQGLKAFDNSVTDLKASFHGLVMTTVAALAPALTEAMKGLAQWVVKNRDLIGGALTIALKVVKGLFEAIAAVVGYVGDLIHRALGGDGGAWAILVGIAGVLTGLILPALAAMVAPIVVALAPLIAFGAAVALVAYGFIKLIGYLPLLKKGVVDAAHWVVQTARRMWHELTDPIVDAGEEIARLTRLVMALFERMWTRLKQFAFDAAQDITNTLHKIPLIGKLADLGEAIGGGAADNAFAEATVGGGGVDHLKVGPSANVRPTANQSTTNHTTINANIRVDGSKDPQKTAEAIQEQIDIWHRHAVGGVGGGQ